LPLVASHRTIAIVPRRFYPAIAIGHNNLLPDEEPRGFDKRHGQAVDPGVRKVQTPCHSI